MAVFYTEHIYRSGFHCKYLCGCKVVTIQVSDRVLAFLLKLHFAVRNAT